MVSQNTRIPSAVLNDVIMDHYCYQSTPTDKGKKNLKDFLYATQLRPNHRHLWSLLMKKNSCIFSCMVSWKIKSAKPLSLKGHRSLVHGNGNKNPFHSSHFHSKGVFCPHLCFGSKYSQYSQKTALISEKTISYIQTLHL